MIFGPDRMAHRNAASSSALQFVFEMHMHHNSSYVAKSHYLDRGSAIENGGESVTIYCISMAMFLHGHHDRCESRNWLWHDIVFNCLERSREAGSASGRRQPVFAYYGKFCAEEKRLSVKLAPLASCATYEPPRSAFGLALRAIKSEHGATAPRCFPKEISTWQAGDLSP